MRVHQKNIGPAGLTIVIVRDDLLERDTQQGLSRILNYKALQAETQSMYNTPPTFAWYVAGEVFKWIKAEGGLTAMAELNQQKSAYLYDYLDQSDFYCNTVAANARSRMNIPFHLKRAELEAQFLQAAQNAGLLFLKGHRVVGGMRASLYNAMPFEGVKALVEFMDRVCKPTTYLIDDTNILSETLWTFMMRGNSIKLQPVQSINGQIYLPGSKSIANRALLLAAFAKGNTRLEQVPAGVDVGHMLNALTALGVPVEYIPEEQQCFIRGQERAFTHAEPVSLFLGNAGTAMRPLCAGLCLGSGEYTLTCEPRMEERPIEHLVDALRQAGQKSIM